ncbi:MAG: cell division protein FtsL [bacterium]|nr:cell division protein FtsL [bacterium]
MSRPYAIHRPVENTYLVRERDRRFVRELVGVVVAVLVLGGGLLAYTWVHIEILSTGYRIDELEKRLHKLLEDERHWRLETASLTHPERIERRARLELGMRAPSLEQTRFYGELLDAAASAEPEGRDP